MLYDFDKVIDRSGTSAVKLEAMLSIWGRADLLPLWVADMDFPTAPFVTEAIQRRCQHEILGYTSKPASYYQSIIRWVKNRYDLEVQTENIFFTPGIVPGIAMAINCFTQPGDKVLIQTPVYPPFSWLVTRNGRQLVKQSLILENGRYHMDLEHFREAVRGCKAFILCNPHNPGGVVWTEKELQTIAQICQEENVLVIADEIHADLTLPPHRHRPFATFGEVARNHSVTFMSPSKAFNMPGLSASHALIFNPELQERFQTFQNAGELDMGHVFAFLSVEAAYSQGMEWLDQCLAYIQGNIDYVIGFLQEHTPKIFALRPEASFLVWLDCRALQMNTSELDAFFADKAGLALNNGATFGAEGEGFMRINVACPRSVLQTAMCQLAAAYDSVFQG